MNTLRVNPGNNPYSVANTIKPVHFFCRAPTARAVYLAGDFNDWNALSHPMERQVDGTWFLEVPLCHGHHHYLFFVDGRPRLDAQAMGAVRNERRELVSLVAVS